MGLQSTQPRTRPRTKPTSPPKHEAILQEPNASRKPTSERIALSCRVRVLDKFNLLTCIPFAATDGFLLATLGAKIAPYKISLSFYGWMIGLVQMMWMFLTLGRVHVYPDCYALVLSGKIFVVAGHLMLAIAYEGGLIESRWFLVWLAIMAWLDAIAFVAMVKFEELKRILSAPGPALDKDVV